ncbi:ADP-ribosylglycohydrolase family protein [Streptomyces sp. NPDC058319]|uniref:ADP-ribosylglycohydrolase family protein n=1 Tax=unclassified Streptomyces TaxID=2593676 RepID=UPI0036E04658
MAAPPVQHRGRHADAGGRPLGSGRGPYADGRWRPRGATASPRAADDTQMTPAPGRGLRTAMERGPPAPRRLERPVREEFVDWSRSPDNNRAPGRTCMVACGLLGDPGRPWQRASQVESKGCGANMRVAPLGLVPDLDDARRAGAAQLQAALTHGHPTALAASDLTAHAVRLLAHGTAPADLVALLRSYAEENRTRYHHLWLGDLWTRAGDAAPERFIARGWDECLEVLDRLAEAVATVSAEDDPCEATGDGWIAEEALATGLLCFLLFPDEPVTALRRAACTRGDSDSLACLAGAFAGAHLGPGAWPEAWTDRIEYRDELLALGALWDV